MMVPVGMASLQNAVKSRPAPDRDQDAWLPDMGRMSGAALFRRERRAA